jgi:hypothetical protein
MFVTYIVLQIFRMGVLGRVKKQIFILRHACPRLGKRCGAVAGCVMLFVHAHVMTLQCLCPVVIDRNNRELMKEFLHSLHLGSCIFVFILF